MAVHHEILQAAQRLAGERADRTFTPADIVRALPHLEPRTVRTHVTSRCCVNAPRHHQSRLAYFRRVGRGRYELVGAHQVPARKPPRRATAAAPPGRDVIHAVIVKDTGFFVVDCLEVPVVTQGRSIDEALANLREAIALHLEGEDIAALGFTAVRRIHVSYELPAADDAA
jgi:predicted RNase H-like HicB family nuclease